MATSLISSVTKLKSDVDSLRTNLCQLETEDSWDAISRSIKSLGDICRNGACDFPSDLILILRSLSRPLTNSMVSERTRLSGVAIDLVSTVASGLGASFEPLLSVFMPILLSLCGRTNKVIVMRARGCITVLIEETQLPSVLPYFLHSVKDKSASLRLTAAEGTLTCMNCFNPPDLEKETRARDIEAIIRATARDAQADIRAVGRKIFEAYKLLLPNRVESFIAPLTPTVKKYLNVKTSMASKTPSTLPQLTPVLMVQNTLSSSTSTLSTRCELGSQQPSRRVRTISSSAPSINKASMLKGKPARYLSLKKTGSAMPPPPNIPVRPSHTSGNNVSASYAEVKRRVLPTSVKPAIRTCSQGAQSSAFPARMTLTNNPPDVPRRAQQPVSALPDSSQLSSGPRRIPIPEVPSNDSTSNRESRADDAKFKSDAPTLMAPQNPKPLSKVPGPPLEKMPLAVEKASKSGGVMQPTLSQISRAKAITRDKPSIITGPRPLRRQPPTQKMNPSIQPASSQQKVQIKPISRPITPTEIALPPSPTSSLTDVLPDTKMYPEQQDMHLPTNMGAGVACAETTVSSDADDGRSCTSVVECDSAINGGNQDGVSLDECHNDKETIHTEPPVRTDLLTPGINVEGPITPHSLRISEDTIGSARTPISALLSSIQRGFLFTPSSPLSPPLSYLEQDTRMKDLSIPVPLNIEGTDAPGRSVHTKRPFIFGGDRERFALSNVDNIGIQK